MAPSERANQVAGQSHRTVVDWTSVMVHLVSRWLHRRPWLLIGDGSSACARLGRECLTAQVALIARLRLDARLFAFPQPVPPGRRGPKPKKGGALPIRRVLVVDPAGRLAPQAFFTTQSTLSPQRVVTLFVLRWSIKVTFEEVRRHLGVESRRQWSALAIARTTPLLLALFFLVCLMVHRLPDCWPSLPRSTAWYLKSQATFSDLPALVRRTIRAEANDIKSTICGDQVIISRQDWERALSQLASTA